MGQSPNGADIFDKMIPGSIEFHQGKLSFTKWEIACSGKYAKNYNKIADKDSLLFCVRAPVGEVNFTNRRLAIGRGLCAIKPLTSQVSVDYLFFVLKWLKNYFISKSTGSTFQAITIDVIKETIIPVPPEKEQLRIIIALKKCFELIDSIESNNNDIKNISLLCKQKILESIFGENSSYKSYYQLNDIFDFQNGYAFPSETYSKTGMPIIRISDLTDGVVTLDNCVKTNQNNIDEKFIVRNGDLLIAMSGATTGKMGVFVGEENCYLNQRVGNIKIKRKDLIIDGYRNYLFMHLKNDILKAAYGGAQPNISGQKILAMHVYLPPLETQKQQIEFIKAAFECLDSII